MSNLGNIFKESRESQGYSASDISQDLKISKDIVRQLEEGAYYGLPSYVYAYGFVKKYAEFLKLDFDEVKVLFDQECIKEKFNSFSDDVLLPVERKPAGTKLPLNKIAIVLLLFIVGAGLVTYVQYAGKKSDQVVEEQQSVDVSEAPVIVAGDNVTEEAKEVSVALNKETKPEEKKAEVVKKKKEVSVMEVAETMKKEKKVTVAAHKAVIAFSDTCWVHVNIDNVTHLDFIADAGMKKNVAFNDNFIMDIGNASVVSVIHNKKRTTGFGGFRQPVKNLKFFLNDNGTLVFSKIK